MNIDRPENDAMYLMYEALARARMSRAESGRGRAYRPARRVAMRVLQRTEQDS